MDTFAHAIWSYIIFHKNKLVLLAILVGVLPDLLSWGLYMFTRIISRTPFGKPELHSTPNWVFTLYGVTHSLIVVAVVFLMIFLIFKQIPVFLWAWPIHILIDIPTHARNFLPTPFLWPYTGWYFPGFNWGNKYFMLTNYSLIIISFVLIHKSNLLNLFHSLKDNIK